VAQAWEVSETMIKTKHFLSAIAKPCGGRFRVTIRADGWAIDTYLTCWPVVYALVLNPTQAEGIAKLTVWVRSLRRQADPRVLAEFGGRQAWFVRGLVADGWFGTTARGLRERWKSDKRTLARLRSGREDYYEPYVSSYHRRRDLAVREWRALRGSQKLLDILEVALGAPAPKQCTNQGISQAVAEAENATEADDGPA
jgi:hypothetical protein